MRRIVVLVLVLLGSAGFCNEGWTQQQMPAMEGAGMRWTPTFFVLAEKFEMAPVADDGELAIDGVAWYGNDRTRLWARGEANINTAEFGGEAQFEVLYGKLIRPFFDRLIGVRIDRNWGNANAIRALLGVGIQGIAPNWFEVEASAFLSQDGDLSARITTTYDVLFTQRLVLEPRLELNASASQVPAFRIGSGITDLELGGRLRYEIYRKFAPYAGIDWQRRFGGTATFAREEGGPVSRVTLIAGLRAWY